MSSLKSWLSSKWLGSFLDIFIANGWDSVEKIENCSDREAENIMQLVTKPGHKLKLRVMLARIRVKRKISTVSDSVKNMQVPTFLPPPIPMEPPSIPPGFPVLMDMIPPPPEFLPPPFLPPPPSIPPPFTPVVKEDIPPAPPSFHLPPPPDLPPPPSLDDLPPPIYAADSDDESIPPPPESVRSNAAKMNIVFASPRAVHPANTRDIPSLSDKSNKSKQPQSNELESMEEEQLLDDNIVVPVVKQKSNLTRVVAGTFASNPKPFSAETSSRNSSVSSIPEENEILQDSDATSSIVKTKLNLTRFVSGSVVSNDSTGSVNSAGNRIRVNSIPEEVQNSHDSEVDSETVSNEEIRPPQQNADEPISNITPIIILTSEASDVPLSSENQDGIISLRSDNNVRKNSSAADVVENNDFSTVSDLVSIEKSVVHSPKISIEKSVPDVDDLLEKTVIYAATDLISLDKSVVDASKDSIDHDVVEKNVAASVSDLISIDKAVVDSPKNSTDHFVVEKNAASGRISIDKSGVDAPKVSNDHKNAISAVISRFSVDKTAPFDARKNSTDHYAVEKNAASGRISIDKSGVDAPKVSVDHKNAISAVISRFSVDKTAPVVTNVDAPKNSLDHYAVEKNVGRISIDKSGVDAPKVSVDHKNAISAVISRFSVDKTAPVGPKVSVDNQIVEKKTQGSPLIPVVNLAPPSRTTSPPPHNLPPPPRNAVSPPLRTAVSPPPRDTASPASPPPSPPRISASPPPFKPDDFKPPPIPPPLPSQVALRKMVLEQEAFEEKVPRKAIFVQKHEIANVKQILNKLTTVDESKSSEKVVASSPEKNLASKEDFEKKRAFLSGLNFGGMMPGIPPRNVVSPPPLPDLPPPPAPSVVTTSTVATILDEDGEAAPLPQTSMLSNPDKAGILSKRSTGLFNSSYKQRYCIIKNKVLYWLKNKTDERPVGMLSLTSATGFTMLDARTVEISTKKKNYIFQAYDHIEMEQWVNCMKQIPINAPEIDENEKEFLQKMNILKVGEIFKKYKKSENPKRRLLWLSPELDRLHWGDEKKNSKGDILINDIMRIDEGCPNATVQENAFELVTSTRSLELEAISKLQKDTFIDALMALLQRDM